MQAAAPSPTEPTRDDAVVDARVPGRLAQASREALAEGGELARNIPSLAP